jgi:hypothetical protein
LPCLQGAGLDLLFSRVDSGIRSKERRLRACGRGTGGSGS